MWPQWPTAVVPVEMADPGLDERDGIEAKTVLLQQLQVALAILHDDNPDRVALVGMHDWTDPTLPAIAEEWGLTVFAPETLRSAAPDRGGLTRAQASRVVADVGATADVVGLTIAEFVPRQVMHLQQILDDFPLLGSSSASGQ